MEGDSVRCPHRHRLFWAWSLWIQEEIDLFILCYVLGGFQAMWRCRCEKTQVSRGLECGSLKEILVSREAHIRHKAGMVASHTVKWSWSEASVHEDSERVAEGHRTSHGSRWPCCRTCVYPGMRKIHSTIRVLWLRVSEGFSTRWHWLDWDRS